MAYKVFANGNPLLASELNDNLMQQVIAVFSSSAARDATITSPVTGQFVFLTDTAKLTYYTGSAWAEFQPAGAAPLSEKIADYTITADDANTTIVVNSAAQETITVDNVLSAGDRIDFIQKGAGQILFDPSAGLTLNSAGSKYLSAEQYAGATILCVASNEYYLIGNLA